MVFIRLCSSVFQKSHNFSSHISSKKDELVVNMSYIKKKKAEQNKVFSAS